MRKISLAAVIGIVYLLGTAAVHAQDYKTKSFNVSRNGHLLVDINYGDITIKSWNRNEVLVKYEDDYDEDESLSIKTAGNHVRIRSYGSNYSDVEVTVPTQFYVEMKTEAGDLKILGSFVGSLQGSTSGGDIIIDKMNGYVSLHTYGGDIKGDEVKGELKIITYGGDIRLNNIEGNGTISTSGGNIQVNRAGKSININTDGGNISIDDVYGKVNLSTGGGNITARNISGDAELNTGGGNIKSSSVKGSVDASTGSGNIYLYNVDGTVNAVSGSGDILTELVTANPNPSRIKTTNGKIKFYISSNTKVNVEARIRGMGGYYNYEEKDFIKLELNPTSRNVSKNSDNIMAVYSFNGGGKKVYLDTSYGEIEIKRLSRQ